MVTAVTANPLSPAAALPAPVRAAPIVQLHLLDVVAAVAVVPKASVVLAANVGMPVGAGVAAPEPVRRQRRGLSKRQPNLILKYKKWHNKKCLSKDQGDYSISSSSPSSMPA